MRVALTRIKSVAVWLLIFIFAVIILVVFVPPAFMVGLIAKFFRRKIGAGLDELAADLRGLNLVLDILGNVTIFNWLWFLFKSKDGYRFGSYKETISFVLKLNYDAGTLRFLGLPLYNFINFLDKGHFDNLTEGSGYL